LRGEREVVGVIGERGMRCEVRRFCNIMGVGFRREKNARKSCKGNKKSEKQRQVEGRGKEGSD
jgi:hypothetical protein